MYTNILIAVDFSEPARAALQHAVKLAEASGGHLTLLHVSALPWAAGSEVDVTGMNPAMTAHLSDSAAEIGKRQMHALGELAEQELPAPMARTLLLRDGVAATEILEQAKQAPYDLICIGTHGRTGIGRAVLGSVAETVVRKSSIPVLTVHG